MSNLTVELTGKERDEYIAKRFPKKKPCTTVQPVKGEKLPDEAAMWTPTTSNVKTGPVPTMYVGRNREESLSSCIGCKQLEDKSCYAQFGTPAIGHTSMIRAAKGGKDYSLKRALLESKRVAKMARFTAVGDLTAMRDKYIKKALKAVRDFGLAPIGYIHMWRENKQWAGVFMASCDDLSQVDEALEAGFRATVVLPPTHTDRVFTTPGGAKGIVCPAMVAKDMGKSLTCNDCLLCDGSKDGPVIGFPNHGPKHRHLRKPIKRNTLERKRSAIADLDI